MCECQCVYLYVCIHVCMCVHMYTICVLGAPEGQKMTSDPETRVPGNCKLPSGCRELNLDPLQEKQVPTHRAISPGPSSFFFLLFLFLSLFPRKPVIISTYTVRKFILSMSPDLSMNEGRVQGKEKVSEEISAPCNLLV